MSLINGSLQIGRQGLQASQAALQVIGNNISNAGTVQYSRQRPILEPLAGGAGSGGMGMGVWFAGIERMADEAINGRLRTAMGDQSAAQARAEILQQIEGMLNPLGDDNLSSRLTEFFEAANGVANEPQSTGKRTVLLQAANSLARSIRTQRSAMLDIRANIDDRVANLIGKVNTLLTEIAELNAQIAPAALGAGGAAANMADRRDAALSELAQLIDINTSVSDGGQVNVFVGSTPLLMGSTPDKLQPVVQADGSDTAMVIRLANAKTEIKISGGQIGGLMAARTTDLANIVSQLDQFAAALIHEVNAIHSQGHPLTLPQSVTGTEAVAGPAAALNQAGLGVTPVNGTFRLDVIAAGGQRTGHVLEIDLDSIGPDTTLASLAAAIDALDNVSAQVNADNTLTVTAASGYRLGFAEDSSGVLAALGINTLFSGSNAADIAVRAGLTADQVAAGDGYDPADNGVALQLAALVGAAVGSLGGVSLHGYYRDAITILGVNADAATGDAEAQGALVDSLTAQREALSGVSVDEETIEMMRYQRAFEGSARFISLINTLLGEIMEMI